MQPTNSCFRAELMLMLMFISLLHCAIACAQGDDPDTVAIIKKHTSPEMKKDKDGQERIYSLSIPNNREALAILPHLDKLEYLKELTIVYQGLKNSDLEALPELPHLTGLALIQTQISDEGLEHLAGMKQLKQLYLSGSEIRGPGLGYLKDLSELKRLELDSTPFDDSGIPHIVKNMPLIEWLNLNNTKVTPDGVMPLADLHWLQIVKFPVDLAGPNQVNVEGGAERGRFIRERQKARNKQLVRYWSAHMISRWKARTSGIKVPPASSDQLVLYQIESLKSRERDAINVGKDSQAIMTLIAKHISPRAISTIQDKNGVEHIYSLGVSNNRIALKIMPHLGNLEYFNSLKLSDENITNESLKFLPPLPTLQTLVLSRTNVSDEGLKHLAGMKNLRQLDLSQTQVRGPGLAYLKDLTELESLDLTAAPLDDSAMPHVAANFKKLRRFDFGRTKVTPQGLMQLVNLHWLDTISPPDDIVAPGESPHLHMEKRAALFAKFREAHTASKQKARAAGIEVPPDFQGPFGTSTARPYEGEPKREDK